MGKGWLRLGAKRLIWGFPAILGTGIDNRAGHAQTCLVVRCTGQHAAEVVSLCVCYRVESTLSPSSRGVFSELH